jgi:hypothetical protein
LTGADSSTGSSWVADVRQLRLSDPGRRRGRRPVAGAGRG